MNRIVFFSLLMSFAWVNAHAAEARITGTLKAQLDYQSEAEQGKHWFLDTPGNELGVLVLESLAGSQFYGVVNYQFDPQAEQPEYQQRHAYLAWQLPSVSLWVGHLPSLQHSYLVRPMRSKESAVEGAFALTDSALFVDNERDAFRAEWRAGEAVVIAAQWLIEEAGGALPWSVVSSLTTPEGTLTASYHRQAEGDPYWGAQVTYLAGQLELAAVGLYQEGWQAWDLQASLVSVNTRSFVTYSVLEQQSGRWQLGVHQQLTASLMSYSEFAKRPQRGNVWTQGFKLSF